MNEVPGIRVVHEDDHHVWLQAGAGEVWHTLVLHAVAQGWGGLENLSPIPGSGARPMQNIGLMAGAEATPSWNWRPCASR